MHFAAWLLVGESVSRPVELLRQQRRRRAGRARRPWPTPGCRPSSSRRPAPTFGEPERAPIDEDHPQRPINAYGETKLAVERALPHFERAYGIRSVALRYFNAAGADPDGMHRRGSPARDPPDPARHRRDPRRRAARRSSATTTRRPTAPACATTSTSSTSPTRTCWRWRTSQGGGSSRAYNLGIGRPFSVREVLRGGRSGGRRAGAAHDRAAAARRSGGALRVRRSHPPRPRLDAGLPRPPDDRRHRVAVARAAIPAATPVASPPGRGRERVPASAGVHAALSRPARGGARRDGRLRRGHRLASPS